MSKQGISLKNKAKKYISIRRLPSIGLIGIITIGILYTLGYSLIRQYSLRGEAERFAKLKQDFLELQEIFNKGYSQWEYSEGCGGYGGVLDRHKATSCSIGLSSSTLKTHEALPLFTNSNTLLNQTGIFTTDQLSESAYSVKINLYPPPTAHMPLFQKIIAIDI